MTVREIVNELRCLMGKVSTLESNSGSGGSGVTPTSTDTFQNKTISGSNNTLSNIAQSAITGLVAALTGKQATLVSGTNIKTVGSNSLLGSGDIPFPTPATQVDAGVFTTGTLPDGRLSSNVALLTATQILTNKTLTRPSINGLRLGISTKTANYTLSTTTDNTIRMDATTGNLVATLPSASGSFVTTAGAVFTIKKIDVSANTVTVDANASELIDGQLTYVLSAQYSFVRLQSNGVSWDIIGKG